MIDRRAADAAGRMSYLEMSVADWKGPIVEIRFRRPVETGLDVDEVLREASEFMERTVIPRASRAYFVTCYDGLKVARDQVLALQDRFVGFNRRYSKGDVRYGTTPYAKTFVLSTSVKASDRPNLHDSRESALAALHRLFAASDTGTAGPRLPIRG